MFIITLNDFYQYVFGDWAKPSALPSKIQLKPEQQQTKSKRDAEAIEAKKKKFSFIIGVNRGIKARIDGAALCLSYRHN